MIIKNKMEQYNNNQQNHWDWQLLFSILFYMAVPSIYTSYSFYLIGNSPPNTNNLAIVSQWQFVQSFFEVIQEALVLPLFYFIGTSVSKGKAVIIDRISSTLTILFVTLIPLLLVLSFFIGSFTELINTPTEIVLQTKNYLTIKVWTLLFSISNIGLVIILEALKRNRILVILTLIKLVLSIGLDALCFGDYSFSLDMGINGLAIANLLTELVTFLVISTLFIKALDINIKQFFRFPQINNFSLFGSVSLGIGIESLVKNVAYFFLIIGLMNTLGSKEIGGYYLSMHLYWSFYLVPILAITEMSRVLLARSSNNITSWQILNINLSRMGLVLLFWCATYPFVDDFFEFFSTDTEVLAFAKQSFKWLLIPYILMSLNMLIDSLFYATGKTQYLAYQSLLTNGLVYLTAYVLYYAGFWQPTFTGVLILFGIGIFVDSLFTIGFARKVLRED
jgi:Na+-driven multidrug efflux pump